MTITATHTSTTTSTTAVAGQLRSLAQLTQTEIQVARTRVAQARTEAVRRELTENATNAENRYDRIVAELRHVGGVPDVVSPIVGRVAALAKATIEQTQPIDEALFGDLMLEHQLLDRARYLRALADGADMVTTRALADRLITAHSATVEWLTTVLAEEALGGPTALRATPVQRLAGGLTQTAALPVRFARDQINRVAGTLTRSGREVANTVQQAGDEAAKAGSIARDVVTAGRDAALENSERAARDDGAKGVAESIHDARTRLGVLSTDELPISGYDDLGAQQAIAAVKELSKTDDILSVIFYEEAHRNRHSVVSAAQTRHATLAKRSAGLS